MSRIHALDLARGCSVLMIAPIHTVMVYSQPYVVHTWLGTILAFIAEGPGAQLFMLCMGIYVTFKPRHDMRSVLLKAGAWALAGYALNVVKFVLPYWLDFLPYNLLDALKVPAAGGTMTLLLTGDILQFAAIAYVLIHIIYRQRYYALLALCAAWLVLLVSPAVWDRHSGNIVVEYAAQLIGGQPPRAFFPLFPWLIYPLLGLVIGYGLKCDVVRTFAGLKTAGIACLVLAFLIRWLVPATIMTDFYRTGWPETIHHIGIVFLVLYGWHWVQVYVPDNTFLDLLRYSSRRITRIYLFQWPLICWMLPCFGYRQQSLTMSLVLIGCVTGLTYALSYAIDALNKYKSVIEQEAEARRPVD